MAVPPGVVAARAALADSVGRGRAPPRQAGAGTRARRAPGRRLPRPRLERSRFRRRADRGAPPRAGGLQRITLRLGAARGVPAPRLARGGHALPGMRRRAEPACAVLPLGGDRRSRLVRRRARKALPGSPPLRGRGLARGKRPPQVARGARPRCAPRGGRRDLRSLRSREMRRLESSEASQRSTDDISSARCT